jgi:hypothetical protein
MIRMYLGRELYRSPNGDAWYLNCDAGTQHGFVLHVGNEPSGGTRSRIDIDAFLASGSGPEQQALLRLIGTLAGSGPDASGAEAMAQIGPRG